MDYNEFMNNPIVMDAVLRNIVIQNYFGIDFNIIWEVITRNIPAEKGKIKKIDITKSK